MNLSLKVRISRMDVLVPWDSAKMLTHIEDGTFCDGGCCGIINGAHEEEWIQPHLHLVLTGLEPETSPRYFAITGVTIPSSWNPDGTFCPDRWKANNE